jgi:hypothetical protein
MATVGQKEISKDYERPSLEIINLIPQEKDITPTRIRVGRK